MIHDAFFEPQVVEHPHKNQTLPPKYFRSSAQSLKRQSDVTLVVILPVFFQQKKQIFMFLLDISLFLFHPSKKNPQKPKNLPRLQGVVGRVAHVLIFILHPEGADFQEISVGWRNWMLNTN